MLAGSVLRRSVKKQNKLSLTYPKLDKCARPCLWVVLLTRTAADGHRLTDALWSIAFKKKEEEEEAKVSVIIPCEDA
jgi:hypothetical protein